MRLDPLMELTVAWGVAFLVWFVFRTLMQVGDE